MPNLIEAQGEDRIKEAYERARDFYLSQPPPEPEVRTSRAMMPSWLRIQPWRS